MNWFDLAVALLVIGCVAGEIRQGFGKSGFGLLAAVAAYLMAAWLAPVNAVVFLVVFVLLACGLGVVAWLLGRFFRDVGPEWFDRLLGGAFGLANALLLAVLALAAWMSFAPRFERESIMRSRTAPLLVEAAWGAVNCVPEDMRLRASESYEELSRTAPRPLRKDFRPLPHGEI